MKTTIEKIVVMQAYLDGKTIQIINLRDEEWEVEKWPIFVTREKIEANTKPELDWKGGVPREVPPTRDLEWDWANLDYVVKES